MSNIIKVVKKMLMDHSFDKNGYEYQFLSIETSKEFEAFDLIVNVNLPKKNQSYCTGVFNAHVHEILDNIAGYLGGMFSYSLEILVNGKEPAKNGLFVSEEKQKQVLKTMNQDISEMILRSNEGMLKFDTYWKRPENNFYSLDDVYINFNFLMEISKTTINDLPVKPNLKMIDETSGAIIEMIHDHDSIREDLEEVIYRVMSDEINLNNIDDLYYAVNFSITKIDGFPSSPQFLYGSDLEKGMFT